VGEQGHRRPELQIIGVAKDLFNGSSLDEVYQPGAFGESWTEDRVRQIGGGFRQRRNGKFAGQRTEPQPSICGKMNHIQWVFLLPSRNSEQTLS
jgi:hypothetical protein